VIEIDGYTIACNFCKKYHKEVQCIIELNEEVHICNECIDICINMVVQFRKKQRNFKLIEPQKKDEL